MKKLILTREQYNEAIRCYNENNCMRNATLEFMNIYNLDYAVANKVIDASIHNYKYLQIKD